MANSIGNLKKYNARRRLKGAVRALMAARNFDFIKKKDGENTEEAAPASAPVAVEGA